MEYKQYIYSVKALAAKNPEWGAICHSIVSYLGKIPDSISIDFAVLSYGDVRIGFSKTALVALDGNPHDKVHAWEPFFGTERDKDEFYKLMDWIKERIG